MNPLHRNGFSIWNSDSEMKVIAFLIITVNHFRFFWTSVCCVNSGFNV